MNKCRITVKRITHYDDLSQELEQEIDHACDMKLNQVFICENLEKPDGLCDSAWQTLFPFVMTLSCGGSGIYGDWMKDSKSALISCNDGFRPVSFLVEAIEEQDKEQKPLNLSAEQLAGMFDHTNLAADAEEKDILQLCREAKEMGAAMVAVNPCWVPLCKEQLAGTPVHTGAAIGFPLGQNTLEVKVFETLDALLKGADEIDYVINISKAKAGDWKYIHLEMSEIKDLCEEHHAICKVIFENCYLNDDQKKKLSQIAASIGVDYIKTSTGKGPGGAVAEDVQKMKEYGAGAVKVKAAGGIRDWKTCRAMIEAGADRIGTSSSLKILKEFRQENQ